tara:strand:+ start:169 stop:621 length:453 start_codon:yes stop_codon:yes gene_type:complete
MTTNKKWILHLEASRSALVCALGFNSYHDYKIGYYRINNYSKRAAGCLRNFLPYCVQKLDEDSGKVIVLNRDYKPIGYCGSYSEWVDYGDFDSAHADMESPEMKAFLNACDKNKHGMWYTFNDVTPPWYRAKNAERLINIIDAALCVKEV